MLPKKKYNPIFISWCFSSLNDGDENNLYFHKRAEIYIYYTEYDFFL